MKKIVFIFGLIFTLMCGCGKQESSRISIENGAFTCTPSFIVDQINLMVESSQNGVLLSLGEYTESGESIYADDLGRLQVTMEADADGNLTNVRMYWDSGSNNENVITSAGAYSGVLLGILNPDNADSISSSISEIISRGYGTVDFDENGVAVSFTSGDGLNWLEIGISDS